MFSGGARLFDLVFTIDKLQHGLSSTTPRSLGISTFEVILTDGELLPDETSSSSRLSGNFKFGFHSQGILKRNYVQLVGRKLAIWLCY